MKEKTPRDIYISMNEIGECYRLNKKYDEALKILKKIMKGKQKFHKINAMLTVARCYRDQNMDEKFLEILNAILKKKTIHSTQKSDALYLLGSLYYKQKNYEKAKETCEELIAMKNPSSNHVKIAEEILAKINKIAGSVKEEPVKEATVKKEPVNKT